MPKTRLDFEVSEEVATLFETLKQQTEGIGTNIAMFTKILEFYRDSRKNSGVETEGMREIKTRYGGKCIGENCKKKDRWISIGERCYYAKGVGLMCIECNDKLEDSGDKDLTKKHLRLRYYERLTKQLMGKAEDLAREIETYELPKKQAELIEKDEKLRTAIEKYIETTPDAMPNHQLSREEIKALTLLLDQRDENKRAIDDVTLFMEQYVKKRKKKTPLEQVQEQP